MTTPLLKNCCYIHPITVNWGDMDAFQHVNNTQYFRYFEHARVAHYSSAGLWGSEESSSQGAIVAEANCRFKAPLTYPDSILIGVQIDQLGADEFVQRYLVYSEKLDRIAAEGWVKVVFYDYKHSCRCNIPPAHYQILQEQSVTHST